MAFRLSRKNSDLLDLRLVQLKGGKAGVHAAEIGRLKIDPKLDVFNALNSDAYYTVRSTTFTPIAAGVTPTGLMGSGGSFLQPGNIIQGRILRIAAVVNW